MLRHPRTAVALAALGVLAGCVGVTSRSEFDEEVRARGGGLSAEFVADSLAVVAHAADSPTVADTELLRLSIDPGSRSVSAQVRNAAQPDFVDSVNVSDGELVSTAPLQDTDELPLDELTFRSGEVALDEIESMTDQALAEFGQPDGYVDRVSVGLVAGELVIELDLSSARRTGTATFDADGTLIAVDS